MQDTHEHEEQATTTKRYVTMTDAETIAAAEALTCAYCGGDKVATSCFCVADSMALPLFLRIWLNKGTADEWFPTNYRRALQTLIDLGPQRRTMVARSGRRYSWPYASDAELLAADYRFIEHGRCEVPKCGVRIVWYWSPKNPERRKVAVNLENCRPHSESCVDPEYFRRRREEKRAQTSAKRKATRARNQKRG